ncbi:glycosyltransferase family 8 protein [Nakamurella deserti]|uniref:glycosyltransferase family 8 protein n=1 Tax=Nakamurella deserti TaxID=2164074 RepID=UPI000DBE2856|nr:glycosyltransferase family 8 protein [Nakamurella deserti]
MNAWVTLLTQPEYLDGVRTLRASLARTRTPHPLVVMVTDAIDTTVRRVLTDDGCLLRDVAPLRPASDLQDNYANARFAEVWTKLEVWRFTEFERVVFLDADMLVVRPMDELFTLPLAPGAIAACHACRCNPDRIASYPADWTPAHCFYTHCRGLDHTREPGVVDDYLNGGTLVLTPDLAVHGDMVSRLAALEDLSRYPFAEQDFLNEYYENRWEPLPYIYNALKTLPFQHPSMWNEPDVKNIHFIIDKPWQRTPAPGDRYHALHQLWWDVAQRAGTAPVTATR